MPCSPRFFARLRACIRSAAVAAILLAGCGAPAQPPVVATPPATVLYIGSSFFYYNNGIDGIVARLARSAEPRQKVAGTLVTIGGAGFDWHDVESYFRPNAVARYTIDSRNVLHFNQRTPLFDAAVMMDCSQCPLHPQLRDDFFAYAKKNAEIVRRHGARPVFFMSWAYEDQPDMTEPLAEAYGRIGRDNAAQVVPAGLAFARSRQAHPDIGLYDADKRHPSPAGSYLAAATLYATLFGRSPVGLTDTEGLPPATALALQQVAWDTVQAYAASP
ncbi:hypothetical protein [Xylophilus sp. GOD-11R]|uniref:hypothetical protein n=1 Tax=Xylophilus sp. GOD-11R TaxID=3089814 RepID=UPI00298D0E06|nr:hypothetical protein [Xylophilus sp. GOD-11R]WPB57349.1 hypothetical protein R9X41_01470 [Xylophilus sp. GOD-11R]